MSVTTIHREDVKAHLRKRYGSLEAFQRAHELSGQVVRDLLRGKSSIAKAAVAAELGVDPDHLVITTDEVPNCGTGGIKKSRSAHRLSGAAPTRLSGAAK